MTQNIPATKALHIQLPGASRFAGPSFVPGALCLALLVLMAGVLAVPAAAETSEAAKAYEEALDQALSIELAEASVAETFASFAKVTGLQLSLHPAALEGKVTYSAQAEKLSNIIDGICRQQKLECYVLAGDPAILRGQPASGFAGFPDNIDLELVDAPIEQVLGAFAVISDQRAQVSGSFEGTLTITMKDQPWPEVLEHICSVHPCLVDWSSEPITVTPSGLGR